MIKSAFEETHGTKIFQYLAGHPNSNAKDITKDLGLIKSELNKFLYAPKHRGILDCDASVPPKWRIVGKIDIPLPVAFVKGQESRKDLNVIIFIHPLDDGDDGIDCITSAIPYLSDDVRCHIIGAYDTEPFDQYLTKNEIVFQESLRGSPQIEMLIYVLSLGKEHPNRNIRLFVVDRNELSEYAMNKLFEARIKLQAKITEVYYINDGWDGLRIHLE